MKKLALFIILIVCAIAFTVPAWSKGKDGDPPVVKTNGGFKADQVISRKDGDPPVVKTGAVLKAPKGIVRDGDPPAPPK
ncbi:MAG: hypothetical protein ACYC6G_17115 [Desulfobaccales bacterium]